MKATVFLLIACITILSFPAATMGTENDWVVYERRCNDEPMAEEVEFTLDKPAGSTSVDLVYQRISFDEEPFVLPVSFDGLSGQITIPRNHTTQPGILYWWRVHYRDAVVVSEPVAIPFIEGGGDDIGTLSSEVCYDIEFNNGNLPNNHYIAGGQGRLPLTINPSVSSKLMELRVIHGATNIHKGVDFAASTGTDVFAMQDGHVHSIQWTDTGSGWGIYILLRHGGYNYYSHYGHLSEANPNLSEGQAVSKGDYLGKTGDTGGVDPHLCTGFNIYQSGNRIALYPFRYFMPDSSSYNNNKDFDFIQTPTNHYGVNTVWTDVDVYPKGSSGGAVTVRIVYREYGQSQWTSVVMDNVHGNTYRYFWPSMEAVMEYYVRVQRQNTGGRWVTRPARHDTGEPGSYYIVALGIEPKSGEK